MLSNIIVYYIPMILVNMRLGGESNRSLINRIRANKEFHQLQSRQVHYMVPS